MNYIENMSTKYQLNTSELEKSFRYLEYYGYNLDYIYESVAYFQGLAGLKEDGEIGPRTLRAMSWPRCQIKDVLPEESKKENKWGIKTLYYYIADRDNDMSVEEWDESIKEAFKRISDVCSLKFIRSSSSRNANIVLSVGYGQKDNFDGPSGTLAWMFLPPYNNFSGQLQGKFDVSEKWNREFLTTVATHEIGHACSLFHSSRSDQLMSPFYNPKITKPQEEDIKRLQDHYGKPEKTDIPSNDNKPVLEIKIEGDKITIPGYRVSKIG